MSDVSQLGGGDTPSPPYTVSPIAGGAYPAGTAVKLNSSGQAVPAKADTFDDAVAVGVLRNASFAGAPADVSWGSSRFKSTASAWRRTKNLACYRNVSAVPV